MLKKSMKILARIFLMISIIKITFETNKTSIVLQLISNLSIDINVQAAKLA